MSPAPMPPQRASSPEAERLVGWCIVLLLLTPLVISGAHLLVARLLHLRVWAGTIGAFAFTVGPPVVGVGFLALTRAFWAAWIAWTLEVLAFGMLALGDGVVLHTVTTRMVLAIVVLPLLLVPILRLQRAQRG